MGTYRTIFMHESLILLLSEQRERWWHKSHQTGKSDQLLDITCHVWQLCMLYTSNLTRAITAHPRYGVAH